MTQPRKKVALEIHGQVLHLWTDSPPERVEAVGELVSRLVEDVSLRTKAPTSQRTVLMALIQLADRHLDLEARHEALKAEADGAAAEALSALDSALQGRT
jgi:hypothetical protein